MTTSSSDQPGMWEHTTTMRFLKWLFSRRIARRISIGFAVLVMLIALFYAGEDLRGWHAWNKYRRELEARGEQLDFRAFIPKPVPDEQNFAATPLIKSWFEKPTYANTRKRRDVDNYSQASRYVSPKDICQDGCSRQFVDLVAWEKALDGTYEKAERLHLSRGHQRRFADEADRTKDLGRASLISNPEPRRLRRFWKD